MSKMCVSCGMPLCNAEDYPKNDESKDYCVHCARPDGSMKSYDEALEGMTDFIVRTQGFDENVARTAAKEALAKQPAWKGR